MIAFLTLFFYMTSLTMCYQRLSVNNNNHNTLDQKPTHLPPVHYPHGGHRWNEPYFDQTMPKNITSLVGKSAYLGCRVKHLGNKTVAWIRHRDLHILTVGTYTYTTDQRFQTSYHRDIDEWTLQIKWAQQRDAGVYECQISTQPVRSYSVNLNIVDTIDSEKSNLLQQYYNDDAFYISSDRVYQSSDDEFAGMFGPIQTVAVPTATILGGPDLYVDKGSTINLTCVIKFSPEPPTHIFWYHQDKVLSEEASGGRLKFQTVKSEESKSMLLIDEADLIDSGKYSCYPSNTEIASIRVHVLQGERPEAMQTNAAPMASQLGVARPAKVINAIVVAFALWQLITFLSGAMMAMRRNGNDPTAKGANKLGTRRLRRRHHNNNNTDNNGNNQNEKNSNNSNNNNKNDDDDQPKGQQQDKEQKHQQQQQQLKNNNKANNNNTKEPPAIFTPHRRHLDLVHPQQQQPSHQAMTFMQDYANYKTAVRPAGGPTNNSSLRRRCEGAGYAATGLTHLYGGGSGVGNWLLPHGVAR